MIRVILHGACGHMGRVVSEIAAADSGIEIAAGIDVSGGIAEGYPVYRSLSECTEAADVIIDFSTAQAVDLLLAWGTERDIPMVVCTTALSDTQLENLREAAGHVAILRSANMSLGVNILMKLVSEAAKTLAGAGFDMEIVEKHHRRKLDAPSGTALSLAECANTGAGGGYTYIYDRSERRQARDDKEIGVSSVRGGTIVGEHSVIFAGQDEIVTLTHEAFSRAIFAKGAVQAAKFLAGKAPGLYTMADVIGS